MKTIWIIVGVLAAFIAGLFTGHRYGKQISEAVLKAKDAATPDDKDKNKGKPPDEPKGK